MPGREVRLISGESGEVDPRPGCPRGPRPGDRFDRLPGSRSGRRRPDPGRLGLAAGDAVSPLSARALGTGLALAVARRGRHAFPEVGVGALGARGRGHAVASGPTGRGGGRSAAAHLGGAAAPRAAASVIVDVTVEVLTQLLFTLLGLALLLLAGETGVIVQGVVMGLAVAIPAVGAFLLVQRHGLFRLIERLAEALERRWPGRGLGQLTGLQQAVYDFYRRLGNVIAGAPHGTSGPGSWARSRSGWCCT
jgi:hypothetical protein